MTRRFRLLAALTALATALGIVAPTAAFALADPAPAAVTALATLDKTASVTQVAPGETFVYTLTVSCSSITDTGCRDAVLSDTVPAPFEVVSAVVGAGANTAAQPVVIGNRVTVAWTTPLGDGTTGILDATTAVVQVTARLPQGVSHDVDGVAVLNTALIEGTNFVDDDAEAAVTPVVPLVLGTTAGKTLSPTSAVATAGTPVTAALTGSNDSNATVTALQLQDPVDPAATPNPFVDLGFTGFGAVTAPAGTTSTGYEVFVGGAWVTLGAGGTLPGGLDPASVRGTRVTFAGAIPAGATGGVTLNLAVTDAAASAQDGTVVANTVRSTVTDEGQSATDDAGASFTLRQNAVTVGATKSFDPALVVAGESSTVTLGATNTSVIPIESLTIREPAAGDFPAAYAFGGFTAGIVYPSGATAGSVTYRLAGGGTQTVTFASGATPAAPGGPIADVVGFDVAFTGAIVPGGQSTAAFRVDTDAATTGLPLTVPNQVAVVGENQGVVGNAVATDDLAVYDEVIEPYIGKQIRPAEILAVPGQVTTLSLTGGLTERPDPPTTVTGSTGSAQQVVIQDPLDPVAPNAWWNAFDLTGIAQTPVPSDASLTVEYYDTTDATWKTLAGPIAGPTIYSGAVGAGVSAVAGGVRFVYDYTAPDAAGFPPGTDFAPNLTMTVRADGRYTPGPPFSTTANTVIPNCAQSAASSATPGVADGRAAMDPGAAPGTPGACPEITLIPADPGTADLIDKTYGTSSSGGLKTVIARSGDRIPSTLSWSTGGYSDLDSVELSDTADPASTPLAQSVYNAFDLFRVEPITPATDPLIAYDQVAVVQLYNGTAWVDAANDPCPAACVGTFPGMNLTTAERASTVGVRLVFVESPARAAASVGDLDAPPVGSGVARSFSNDRPVTLTWQVRDTRRTDGTPVLGDETYNRPGLGVVRNTARATGYPSAGGTLTSTALDDVTILDVPLTTSTNKIWTGGPLGIPDAGSPTSAYPLSTVSITTRNTTPARVDQLSITDPATPGSASDPFDEFTFNRFPAITVPAGATGTVVTVSLADGTQQTFTRAAALALTAASFTSEVTGVRVDYTGRIAAGAAGNLQIELRLRPSHRDGSGPITPADSPARNEAQGVVTDVGGIGGRTASDLGDASIVLAAPTYTVTAGKTISPATQKENDFSPVTVTISGQPGGSTNTVSMTLVDDDATFWNAFDYLGVGPSFAYSAPIERAVVSYLDGGIFIANADGTLTVLGGTWTDSPQPLTLAEAKTFLANAPSTLHGLRFTFTKANGADWFNPSYPVQSVPILVERRTDLRSGGPVPTTRSDQVPTPGETAAGQFVDTVRASGVSDFVSPTVQLTAADSADAEYRNLHLEAAISVAKTPNGNVRPGVAVPYVLSFTNTGELPLVDPVFSDRLPLDANGDPELIFDPDRDPSVDPWSFSLTGAAPVPPGGTALPTDPAEVDVTVGDVIFFRMPAGSVLEPGQTYRITMQLMVRPGIVAGQQLQNWAAIAVDVPIDACVPTFDPATGECMDDAIVSPLEVPALSTVKYVKADTPVSAPGVPPVIATANDYDCSSAATTVAGVDGFYRAPCVPVTIPGDTETWRFTVTNAGTLPLDTVVSMDNLPTPGDQGLIVPLPRGSQWQPTLVDTPALVGAPPGATLTTYYSTSSTPCTSDLNPLGVACSPGAWLPLDAGVDRSTVRSLKYVVSMGPTLLGPGDSLTLQFQTRTTPQAPASTAYPLAYNTVSTGGAAVAGATRVAVPASEGRRVGVTYPTAPISLQKIVTGDAAQYAPAQFRVQPTCQLDGRPLTGLSEVVLAPGATPTVVSGLPWGAECSATETAQGQTDQTATTVVVGGGGVGLVTVTNRFDGAVLTVRKVVDSAAVDASGAPVVYGPFTFEAACTYGGDAVYATGFDASTPMVAELSDGDAWALAGLPLGAECTVTETDTAGAASVSMSVEQPGAPPVVTPGPTVTVTVGASSGIVSTSTNFFGAGDLTLQKLVSGPGAADFGAGPFVFRVTCTLAGATVWDGDVTLGGGSALTATVANIAAGADCTVTETGVGGATTSVVSPGSVTIVAGAAVTATATNTFETGSLSVTKVIAGPGAAQWGAGPFEVTLACVTAAGAPVAIPGGPTRALLAANGYAARYDPLLTGSRCTLTESVTGGAALTTITDAAGAAVDTITVATGVEAQLIVTNTFALRPPADPSLPATGGDPTLALTVGGIALLLVGGGAILMLVSRRRRRN